MVTNHGISRRRSGSEAPERTHPPAHDVWADDLYTGVLELRLETLPGRFVSPGTGRLSLLPQTDAGYNGKEDLVVQAAAKAAGQPVIPGSGIKGAVRTLYEILSDSCDVFSNDKCDGGNQGDFSSREYCEACSLFGCMGWRGRVCFSDAFPAEPESVQVGVHWVPAPWEPKAEETRGDFRLYDLDEATASGEVAGSFSAVKKNLAREGYQGLFSTRLNFWNTTALELGRLLLAMGLSAAEATAFPIRLGGCKYDGQGAVSVKPVAARLVSPDRKELEGGELRKLCNAWIAQARVAPWFELYQSKLDEVCEILRTKPGEV